MVLGNPPKLGLAVEREAENLKEYLHAGSIPNAATNFAEFIPTHFDDTVSFRFIPLIPTLDIYKFGHFIMFTLLATAIFGARLYRAASISLFGYLVLFALITEVSQLFMVGRTGQFGDIIIDSLGIALGMSLSILWEALSNRLSRKGPGFS